MKKAIALILAIVLVVACFAACGGNKDNDSTTTPVDGSSNAAALDVSKIKFGLICLHDENSTYDNNFILAIKDAQKALGLKDDQILIKKNIPEDDSCYNAAAELVEQGCNIIFADSFGHESFMIQAAKEFKDVQFCHATGTQAKQVKLANFHNAFASIYEGRYLAGVAAGMKLN